MLDLIIDFKHQFTFQDELQVNLLKKVKQGWQLRWGWADMSAISISSYMAQNSPYSEHPTSFLQALKE
jgi:hypothetical protein